ncbi:MAG: PAS-domain containing protein, partial [Xylophilus sp.]|nr:PAS-domain containing protein [Xylophilus sp.]
MLLLFLALVLGAAVFALVLVSGDQPDGQLTRLVVFGVSVAVLVCASLQQWWLIRQLQKTSERASAAEIEAVQARTRLDAALDILPDAFVLFDRKDRLVLCNARFRALYPKSAHLMVPGARFEDIIRHSARAGAVASAVGREEPWVQTRLAQHRKSLFEGLQELAGDRWVRVTERKTPDGGTIGLYTDVTAFKHNERALHAARKETHLAQLQLHEALEAMPAGLEIYDEQDRLIVYNQHLAQMAPHIPVHEALGHTYEH